MAFKLRTVTKFPALVTAAVGLAVERTGRTFNFIQDWLSIGEVDSIADLSSRYVILVSGTDSDDHVYERIPLDAFAASLTAQVQEITDGGAQDIDDSAAIVKVNQTAGAPITLTLPLASSKIGKVKVVDWKGDAATNNITIALSGSDEFQDGQTTMVISGDGGSLVFDPIPGDGYAV